MGIRIPESQPVLGLLAGLALLGGPAGAETLSEVLAARGMPAPPSPSGRSTRPSFARSFARM
jgi:hypothetical protein